MSNDNRWHYEHSWEHGFLDGEYEVHRFEKNGNHLDHYETEELLNELEELLQEAHDKMDDDNAQVALNAYCR